MEYSANECLCATMWINDAKRKKPYQEKTAYYIISLTCNYRQCKLTYSDRKYISESVVGVWYKRRVGERNGREETFRDDGYVHYLILEMVLWLYGTYVKT